VVTHAPNACSCVPPPSPLRETLWSRVCVPRYESKVSSSGGAGRGRGGAATVAGRNVSSVVINIGWAQAVRSKVGRLAPPPPTLLSSCPLRPLTLYGCPLLYRCTLLMRVLALGWAVDLRSGDKHVHVPWRL
jgi:hypothetical protein